MIMPAILVSIISWVQMAIHLGEDIGPVINAARAFIASLFGDKAISKAQQDALFAELDRIASDFENGKVPDWWVVEPDPE